MEIQTDISLEKFSNLKVSLRNSLDENSDEEIYAKVIKSFPDEPSTFRINITSASKLNIENGEYKII